MAITRITKGVIKPNENYDTHDINSTGIVTTTGLDVNGNADVSGSLSIGGVLTYEDVTSIDSVGIITAQKGIHVGAGVSAVGVGTFGSLDIGGDIDVDGHTNLDNVSIAGVTTTTDDIIIGADNKKLKLGAGEELQLYQAGNHSIIQHNGGHYLLLRSNAFAASSADGTKNMFAGFPDTHSSMYYNGSYKIRTQNTGAEIVGTIVATGADINGDLDVDGHTNLDNVSVVGVSTFSGILDATNTPASIRVAQDIQHKGDADTKITFPAADNISLETGGSERVRLNNSSFILKNSTNFGVGGYANPLQSGYNGAVIQLHQSSSGSSVGAQIRFTINDLGAGATDGMFLSYWGNKYFYLQQRETGGGYIFQNTDSTGTLSTPLTINSDSNIQIARDLDVDGHTELDNVRISGITTISGEIRKPLGTYHPMLTIRNQSGGSVAMRIDNWSNSASTKRMSITHNFNRISSAFAADDSSIGCASVAFEDGEIRFGTSAAGTNNSSTRFKIDSSGHFLPHADSTYDIGTNSVRVRNVYADTLYGDGSNLTGITGTTINNNADNRIITGSGTANTLEGESTLTYNGLQLNISNTVPELFLTDTNSNNSYGRVRGNGGNLILSADVNNATGGTRIINFEIGGSEKGRITSDGHVLFGSTTSRNVGGSTTNSKLQIEGTSTNTSSLSLVNNQTSSAAPFIFFGKTRGNSVGESGIVQNGDTLGGLSFIGADGNDTNNRTAEITAVVNGGPGNNTIPTDLTFSTSTQNATQMAERMRIYSTGRILIGNGASEQGPAGNLDIVGDINGNGGELYLRVSNNNVVDNIGALLFGNNVDKSIVKIQGVTHTANNTGDITFHTSTTGTMSEKARITSDGHVVPSTDATQDLGNSSQRWRNVYTTDLQLSNVGGGGNEVDGTEGNWTLQEGESHIYMINRKTGKKYVMMLKEVD